MRFFLGWAPSPVISAALIVVVVMADGGARRRLFRVLFLVLVFVVLLAVLGASSVLFWVVCGRLSPLVALFGGYVMLLLWWGGCGSILSLGEAFGDVVLADSSGGFPCRAPAGSIAVSAVLFDVESVYLFLSFFDDLSSSSLSFPLLCELSGPVPLRKPLFTSSLASLFAFSSPLL